MKVCVCVCSRLCRFVTQVVFPRWNEWIPGCVSALRGPQRSEVPAPHGLHTQVHTISLSFYCLSRKKRSRGDKKKWIGAKILNTCVVFHVYRPKLLILSLRMNGSSCPSTEPSFELSDWFPMDWGCYGGRKIWEVFLPCSTPSHLKCVSACGVIM